MIPPALLRTLKQHHYDGRIWPTLEQSLPESAYGIYPGSADRMDPSDPIWRGDGLPARPFGTPVQAYDEIVHRAVLAPQGRYETC